MIQIPSLYDVQGIDSLRILIEAVEESPLDCPPEERFGLLFALQEYWEGATLPCVIYGVGGVHRYFLWKGEVWYSASHGQRQVFRARDVGFSVFD